MAKEKPAANWQWWKRAQGILVVEDDAVLRQLIVQHLRSLGFDVEGAPDAAEAWARLNKQPHRFDLLLSDIHLPGPSGLELGHEMHAWAPVLPIVFITGDPSPDVIGEASAEGAVLLKPFTLAELEATVRQALAQSRYDKTRQRAVAAPFEVASSELRDLLELNRKLGFRPAGFIVLALLLAALSGYVAHACSSTS